MNVKATPVVSPPKELIAKVSESLVSESPLPVPQVLEVSTTSDLQLPLPDHSDPVLEIGTPADIKSESVEVEPLSESSVVFFVWFCGKK